MKQPNTLPSGKPYDIRERLFLLACDVVGPRRNCNAATRSPVHFLCSWFLAKDRITLRELKESRLRLRVLRSTGYIDATADPLIQESVELVRILATIIRNAQHPPQPPGGI